MINYKFKSEVLRTDIPKLANQISKAIYAEYLLETTGEILKCNIDYDTAIIQRCFLLEKYPKEYAEAEKINLARYKRVKRLKERIAHIMKASESIVFVTLTFTDEVLANTSAFTRRRYVQRFLTDTSADYVGNIDFGAKNGREHYHAVVGKKIDLKEWEYGYIFAETVGDISKAIPKRYKDLPLDEQKEHTERDNQAKLSKYIAKLTNHAIKETTHRSVCIYSRKAVQAF